MEALFRFNQFRRPAPREDVDPIPLEAPTDLQNRLAAAMTPGVADVKAVAQSFVVTGQFVTGDSDQPDDVLDKLQAVVRVLREPPDSGLDAAIAAVLGRPIADFLDDARTRTRILDLKDSVLAIKLLPAEHRRPIDRLVEWLRAHEFLARAVTQGGSSLTQESAATAMRRPLSLPSWLTRPRSESPPRSAHTIRDQLVELAKRYDELDGAIADLHQVPSSGFQASPQEALPEHLPPAGLRATALFETEVRIRDKVLEETLRSAATVVARSSLPSADATTNAATFLAIDALAPSKPGLKPGRGALLAIGGRPAFLPQKSQFALRLEEVTIGRLSSTTLATLSREGLDVRMPLPAILTALTEARTAVNMQARALVQPLVERTSFRRRGGTLIRRPGALATQALTLTPKGLLDLYDQQFPATAPAPQTPSVPFTHSDLAPAGVMDLLIVRQTLKGYERGEVAHVENVLQGEVRDRVVRSRTETETTYLTETEQQSEKTSSLETTDRFEIRREAQTALQERANAHGSLSVSGSYGPTVDFQANADASWSRDSQKSESSASSVAREVTQTASERVAERIMTRQTRRTLVELEESDRHTFENNKSGAANVVGIYQWLTKVYEAQVYNYGARCLYELMVPEPGATLLESFRRSRAEAVELSEPPRFSLRPQDLTPDIYQSLVTLYGATGVKPPPQPYVTQAYDFSTGGESEDQEFTNSTSVKVPEGYRAVQATVGIAVMVWDDWCADVVVGQRTHRFASGNHVWTTPLNDETDAVPFGVATDKVGDIALGLEIHCVSTPRALALWQSEVHGQLTDAYRARLSEYEAKLAALQADAPPDIRSRSSYRNREMIVEELKRCCISLLTEQHFELFDAVDADSSGIPRILFSEARAEGAYVRFFEHAFEWENLSWVSYPYFWGRRENWFDRLEIQDGDPDFEAFLKAGYARVVLPVRPGFEAAVDHFRKHGEPWFGGPLPTVSDALYLPIAQEIAERLDRPGNEVPSGDPWEVRVPTSLLVLRNSTSLPRWNKQSDGTWLPDDQ